MSYSEPERAPQPDPASKPAGDHHPTTPAGSFRVEKALIPVQTGLAIPSIIAARKALFERSVEKAKFRRQSQRKIRPMAMRLMTARETDEIFKVDRAVKFNIIEMEHSDGDERSMHERTDPLIEEYIDADGQRKTRKLSPEDVLKKLRAEGIALGFEDESKTLEELLPQRIQVAWRIIRELGRWKNIVLHDELLIDALHGTQKNPDPWLIPSKYEPPANPAALTKVPQAGIDLIIEAEFVPQNGQITHLDLDTMERTYHPGVGVMPPPVPAEFESNLQAYDPYKDKLLKIYIDLVKLVVKKLGIEKGSIANPEYGRYGLIGMTDIEWVRFVFPTRMQIIAWEEIIVEEALECLIADGPHGARKALHKKYGFVEQELSSLLRLAQIRARTIAATDIEEGRSLMLLRLDDFVKRARGALDLRNELAALKQIAIVGGLSKEQDNPLLDSMIDAVGQIAAERKHQRELAARNEGFIEADARVREGD